MWRIDKGAALAVIITVALLSGSSAALRTGIALADPDKLAWSIVATPAPGQPNNIIVSPSEVNSIVIGTDGNTMYSLDIPNKRIFKSLDGGSTWPVQQELGARLTEAGAYLPAWNIAIAPDDPSFIVAVTDGNGAPNGPKEVFASNDGGTSWNRVMSGLVISPGPPDEFISSVDISVDYGGNRDIAIGTRTGTGNGKVWVAKIGVVVHTWKDQGITGDVVAMKFSPTYTSDLS
ncbi:MAG: hypothetical protein FJZ88_04125, partial [Chloroflexi bacterium]|nr:hypothetical protein [Chloroflexota bacterium]